MFGNGKPHTLYLNYELLILSSRGLPLSLTLNYTLQIIREVANLAALWATFFFFLRNPQNNVLNINKGLLH